MPKKITSKQLTATITVSNEKEYVVSQWSGCEHYVCKKCVGFDTFRKIEMLNHLINVHNSESALEELLHPHNEEIASPAARNDIQGEINNGKTNVDEDYPAG